MAENRPTSLREIELELQKTKHEADAARLEARATQLLIWLEQAQTKGFEELPHQPFPQEVVQSLVRETPWRSREVAAWKRLAEGGWCRDLESCGSLSEQLPSHLASDLYQESAPVPPAVPHNPVVDFDSPPPLSEIVASSPTLSVKEEHHNPITDANLKVQEKSSAVSTSPYSSVKRFRGIGASFFAHVIGLLLLAFWSYASQEPRDVLALSASSPSSSETPTLETVQMEATEAPTVATNEPTPDRRIDPLGELPAVAVPLSNPTTAAKVEPLSDLLSLNSPASKSLSALNSATSDSATIFCGVSTGGNRICFLVDSSKSMNEGRFEAARSEVLRTVDQLSAEKRFFVIFFDVNPAAMCLNSATPERYLAMATPENKRALRTWAMTIELERGAAPDKVLQHAFDLGPEVIFLLTDGEFPEKTEKLILELNRRESLFDGESKRCILHTIAFHGKEGIDRMTRIAKQNGGTFKYQMPIEIALHRWKTNTRPCDFSLCLSTPRGAVFADFDAESDHRVSLRRISFDGYGCYEAEGNCSKMNLDDSTTLIVAISKNDVNNHTVLDILYRYFVDNDSIIWRDALSEHRLLKCGHSDYCHETQ
jgi:hypothetical protein